MFTTPLGQTESIYLKTKTKMVGNFQLVERRVLNTPARPCEEAESYSFTRCLLEFVAGRLGCHLDWVGTHRLAQYPPCRSLKEIEKYSDLLEEMKDYSLFDCLMVYFQRFRFLYFKREWIGQRC